MCVALRKESVDRNISEDVSYNIENKSLSARRAWIEILLVYLALIRYLSLSARRAWIEMVAGSLITLGGSVALRKESVDRNRKLLYPGATRKMSLSARRAWIEILPFGRLSMLISVALRKESVDRNSRVS